MTPLMLRAPEVAGDHWDQDVAYIASDTAKAIDKFVSGIAGGQIRCDVHGKQRAADSGPRDRAGW